MTFPNKGYAKGLEYFVHKFLTEKITDCSQMDVIIKVFKGTGL